VSDISFGDDLTASLKVSGLDWHEAFYITTVNFGSGDDWSNIQLRDQKELRKRQVQSTSQAAATSQAVPSTTLPFSAPPPSASATLINESINFQKLNTVIMPPQNPILDQFV